MNAATPIHELLRRRWSPRSFLPQPLPPGALASLLEAARWAPSAFNEQPWRIVAAVRENEEDFERIASCLVEANGWARSASALLVAIAKTTFTKNGRPNAHSSYDLGASVLSLSLQAHALDLAAHEMAGFDPARTREVLGIPDGFEPMTIVAVGSPGPADALPPRLREAELAPRVRLPLSEIAFGGRFGAHLDLEPRDRR
ncbi:MAG TPA: nitroreductase [Planctomycetes bacterium]|nr:nitroreductase [Planctomycetota bacterium]